MREKKVCRLREQMHLSWKDTGVTAAVLLATTGVCLLLRRIDDGDVYVAELFLLAVFVISRFTSGYFYGIIAALLSVLAVNFLFTFPYLAFNFTISGYPLTILCMLVVSVVTSAMTTQTNARETCALRLSGRKRAAICCGPYPMTCARR